MLIFLWYHELLNIPVIGLTDDAIVTGFDIGTVFAGLASGALVTGFAGGAVVADAVNAFRSAFAHSALVTPLSLFFLWALATAALAPFAGAAVVTASLTALAAGMAHRTALAFDPLLLRSGAARPRGLTRLDLRRFLRLIILQSCVLLAARSPTRSFFRISHPGRKLDEV
mmetsp:Transcript_81377/g.264143  ORF Transcript_81377/g.264143 Transcript_81377/m.264143 type:complete len:170 (-) Transcript_81377:60-569(-)